MNSKTIKDSETDSGTAFMEDIAERLNGLEKRAHNAKVTVGIQLPLWPSEKRGVANSMLRSALFSAIQGKDRSFMKQATVFSQKGIVVKFTGEQLNQEDLTLWETLVHLVKYQNLGTKCVFTTHQIMKAVGLAVTAKGYKTISAGIDRLNACAVYIQHDKRVYGGSLIEGLRLDEKSSVWEIRLDPGIIKLYDTNTWTAIDWNQRIELRRQPLTQFLHGYYSSHQKPFPVKVRTFMELSGSKNKQLAGFRRLLVTAHENLINIGFLSAFQIYNDKVTVFRITDKNVETIVSKAQESLKFKH